MNDQLREHHAAAQTELIPTATPITPNTPVLRQEAEKNEIARWEENPDVRSNIALDTKEGATMMMRCLSTADMRVRNAVGQIVECVGYVAHMVEITDTETGEVADKTRVVLLLADGRTLSMMSRACVRAMRMLSRIMPAGRWEPPVRMEFKEYPLEGGKSYVDMRVVDDLGARMPNVGKKASK